MIKKPSILIIGFLFSFTLFAQGTQHIVRRGETLKSIATAYKTTEQALLDANPNVNAGFLVVGITLTLPTTVQTVQEAPINTTVRSKKDIKLQHMAERDRQENNHWLKPEKKEPAEDAPAVPEPQESLLVFPQPCHPEGVDNYHAVLFYFNGEKAYNIQGREMSSAKANILSLRVNPAGYSYAVLASKKGKTSVTMYSISKENEVLFRFKEAKQASAICFSPDARTFMIANEGRLAVYDIATYTLLADHNIREIPLNLCASNNGYYLAGSVPGGRVVVWNRETMAVRKEILADAPVTSIAFSDDNSYFAILSRDGKLSLYDARSFLQIDVFDHVGEAWDFAFHPEGKYISVVQDGGNIVVVNTMDAYDRYYYNDFDGGITKTRIVQDNNDVFYLVYNTNKSITYRTLDNLAPNYTRLMEEELKNRMDEWLQRMPGESLEEYRERVNEETRAEKARLIEEEIATRLAGNLVYMSEITLGNYNSEYNLLAVNFSTMPTIFLPVPESEVSSFRDTGNLDFRNVKYGLTKNDRFEMIYAEVYNRQTGKTYTFDNLARRTLSFLYSDDQFVPLELIEQASMEEVLLAEIKEKVVEMAKHDKVITDHTKISVDAHVVNDYDADGKRIWNYEVGFDYDVSSEYSSRDDFPAGKYLLEESAAAISMLRIVKQAFEGSIAQYVTAGKKLRVRITGSADAAPIRGFQPYNGVYGEFVNEPIYQDGSLTAITVTKAQGFETNEQLAFLRAIGVRRYIERNIRGVELMQTDYSENIEVSKKRGGAYRRISVVFTFVDAF